MADAIEVIGTTLAELQKANTEQSVDTNQLRERLKSIETKFPEATELQKFADANQLFVAYQIGELTKRLDRMERGQVTRLHVIGYVITTLVAAVALTSGVLVLLQAVHVLR